MSLTKNILFGLLFAMLIVACNNKIAVYSGIVKYSDGEPIINAVVSVIKNGEQLLTAPDNIGIKDVELINKGRMIEKTETDTNGYFSIAFEESYFFFEPKIQLLISKLGYKDKIIDIRWHADLDNEIYLEKEHCDE